MSQSILASFLRRSRQKSLELLDAIAARPLPQQALGWRPGAGRAHIAWQLMHVAATDDRHLHVRMKGGEPAHPDFVRRFAGGSTPDDDIPSLDAIRGYLTERRQELVAHLESLSAADLSIRPNPQMEWNYAEWFEVLAWHEAHHHGQAHLTYNMYRGQHDSQAPKVGH